MTSVPSELNIFATESDRRDLVVAYRKSGLSQKVFCEQHGVKASTFKNWFYRYPECSQLDAIGADVAHFGQTLAPSFLFKAITVQEDVKAPETPTPFSPAPKTDSVAIEPACLNLSPSYPPSIHIECSAFRIAVPTGFDAATLHSILSIMRTLP